MQYDYSELYRMIGFDKTNSMLDDIYALELTCVKYTAQNPGQETTLDDIENRRSELLNKIVELMRGVK